MFLYCHLNAIVAGQKDAPEFAVFRCLKRSVAPFDFHGDVLQRPAVPVENETAHSSVGLANKADKGRPMFAPVDGQFRCRRVLAAGHFDGDLHRARPDVRIVLSSARQRIPGGSVGRPVGERGRAGLARHSLVHGSVIACVRGRQMMEDVIIWRQ